jgi:phospholipid/cholesterol/gamma-HCH transport system substrate-binding protein
MTTSERLSKRAWLRIFAAAVLVPLLVAGVFVIWPSSSHRRSVVAYFTSAVGLYPGDDVRVVGVPVGTIQSIEPLPDNVKVTMRLDDRIPIPTNARAILIAPNLVSARFVQLTPQYTGGPILPDGASLGTDPTGVPVEWDDVKKQLTDLGRQLGPKAGDPQGPVAAFINQAAESFTGSGDSFRSALRELSQTTGRLADSRSDLFGTIKNLQVLVNALSKSNDQIVQFTDHVASVSQALASSSRGLDDTLATLNQALRDLRKFLGDNNAPLIDQINKLAQFTSMLNSHSEDIEQILHVGPNGLANFYNMYSPAQATFAGLLTLPNMTNPMQFICGTLEAGASPDYYKRAEICRQRMAPVLKRLAMHYPPFLFHPIDSITAYKGQIAYDAPDTEAKAQTPVPYLQWMPLPDSIPTPGQTVDPATLLIPPAPSDTPTPPPPADPGAGQSNGPGR